MMKIAAIAPIGLSGRYKLTLDNGKTLTLHEDVLVKHRLLTGKELNPSLLKQLMRDDHRANIKQVSLRYLSIRTRSSFELRRYLMRKGYSLDEIEDILVLLTEEGYLNDEKFAEEWVKSRLTTNLRGPYLIKHELLQKGIEPDLIEQALEQIGDEGEYQACLQWAIKKLKVYQNKAAETVKKKLYRTLIQRGFSPDTVTAVIQHLNQTNHLVEQEDEEFYNNLT